MNRRQLFKLLLAAPVAAVAGFKLAKPASVIDPYAFVWQITTRTFNSTTGEWVEYQNQFVSQVNKDLALCS